MTDPNLNDYEIRYAAHGLPAPWDQHAGQHVHTHRGVTRDHINGILAHLNTVAGHARFEAVERHT